MQVSGIRLYYELRGSGEPLVLIPGLGGDIRLFGGLFEPLTASCRVLAFDPRGAGQSDKPDIPYSIGMMADDTVGLMQAVGMPSATLVGFSMGGRIALAAALARPASVRRLVLVSTAAGPVRQPRWFRMVMEVVPRLPILTRLDPQTYYAHVRQRSASRAFDCSSRLGEIQVPTLVLHGHRDHVVPYEFAEELRRGIRGTQLVSFEGGHRFFRRSERARVVKCINDFAHGSA
jgi:3-oxoadipate enol-lactonase